MQFQNWIVKTAFLIGSLIVLVQGCEKKMLTKEQIINVANREFLRQGFELKEYEVNYDIDNVKSSSRIASIRETSADFAERFNVLVGCDYQAVEYKRRGKNIVGGVFWVFVNRKTGEVLTVFGEK